LDIPRVPVSVPGAENLAKRGVGAVGKLGISIATIKNWRLHKRYNWEILLPDVAGESGVEVSKYCHAVSFGDYSIESLAEIKVGPYQAKYANFFKIGNIRCVFWMPVPDIVGKYFYAWRRLVVDEKGHYFPKLNYAKVMYVFLFDEVGQETRRFKLEDVFPLDVPKYDLSYEGGEDLIKITAELNVDRMSLEESSAEQAVQQERELRGE